MWGKRSALYVMLMVLAAGVAGYMVARQLSRSAPALSAGTALPAARPVAPFVLTDHRGKAFSNARLTGTGTLMFFGFTHCPDVCPTTLALLAQLARDPALQKLQLLFVTVDPRRDDVPTMQRYVDAFGGQITGLTGTDAALEPLLTSLGVARAIQPRAGDDYAVDHSAALFYVNSRGAFSAVFTPPLELTALRHDLVVLLNSNY
jgi:protein SCO1